MIKNSAASVKQRLLNLSRKGKEEFNQILIRYCLERLHKEYAMDFVPKKSPCGISEYHIESCHRQLERFSEPCHGCY